MSSSLGEHPASLSPPIHSILSPACSVSLWRGLCMEGGAGVEGQAWSCDGGGWPSRPPRCRLWTRRAGAGLAAVAGSWWPRGGAGSGSRRRQSGGSGSAGTPGRCARGCSREAGPPGRPGSPAEGPARGERACWTLQRPVDPPGGAVVPGPCPLDPAAPWHQLWPREGGPLPSTGPSRCTACRC